MKKSLRWAIDSKREEKKAGYPPGYMPTLYVYSPEWDAKCAAIVTQELGHSEWTYRLADERDVGKY